MKTIVLLILVGIAPAWQLMAQTTDPELAEKLKSVMLLFDKNQQALKQEIVELNTSNTALTEANLKLYQDLQAARKRVETLESENLLLRSKISEVAVRELESASLKPTLDSQALSTTADTTPAPRTPASPVRTPNRNAANPDLQLVNINSATLEELASLPLIDEAMAEQIISNRPYKTIEDLIINQGFGPMKLRRITPFVTAE